MKAGLLSTKVLSFVIRWYNRNKTTKCLKGLQKRSIDDRAIFVWPWKTDSLCVLKLFLLPLVFEFRPHFPLRTRDAAPNMETALFGRPIKNLWNGWRSLKARSDLKHMWNEGERKRLSWMCDFLWSPENSLWSFKDFVSSPKNNFAESWRSRHWKKARLLTTFYGVNCSWGALVDLCFNKLSSWRVQQITGTDRTSFGNKFRSVISLSCISSRHKNGFTKTLASR